MSRHGDAILLASGRTFWPLDPHPDDIDLRDIIISLSHQGRFTGHTRSFYSVSEHSFSVAQLLHHRGVDEDVARWGLLHDASEAYLVDLPRPLKRLPEFGLLFREAEDRLQECIAEKFELAWPMPQEVHDADTTMLCVERRDLMPASDDPNLYWPTCPWPEELIDYPTIHSWPPGGARRVFARALEDPLVLALTHDSLNRAAAA